MRRVTLSVATIVAIVSVLAVAAAPGQAVEQGAATASITIHKSSCPADVAPANRFAQCHPNGLAGVDFTLQGPENRTGTTAGDLGAVTWNGLAAGTYTVAEAAPSGEFIDYAVFCSRQDSSEAVSFEKRGDGRAAVQIELSAGAQVVCDWYDIAQAPLIDFRIAAFDCPTDPGNVSLAAGNIPADCTPASGASFTVADASGAQLASCAADSTGLCIVKLASGTTVTVTEDVASLKAGFAPRQNPIVTQVLTEFAGALFINLPTGQPMPTAQPTTQPPPPAPTPSPTPVVKGRPVQVDIGTCADLITTTRFPLTDLTTPTATPEGSLRATVAEASFTTIDISLDQLLASPHAIDVRASGTEQGMSVACGEIGGPRRADGSIIVGLRELNRSGMAGIAYLVPDTADPTQTDVSIFLARGLTGRPPQGTPVAEAGASG